jgi:hypothetical protein
MQNKVVAAIALRPRPLSTSSTLLFCTHESRYRPHISLVIFQIVRHRAADAVDLPANQLHR